MAKAVAVNVATQMIEYKTGRLWPESAFRVLACLHCGRLGSRCICRPFSSFGIFDHGQPSCAAS